MFGKDLTDSFWYCAKRSGLEIVFITTTSQIIIFEDNPNAALLNAAIDGIFEFVTDLECIYSPGCVQWLTELLLSYPNLTTWVNIKLFKIHAQISDGYVRAYAFVNVFVFIARVSDLNDFLGSVLSV